MRNQWVNYCPLIPPLIELLPHFNWNPHIRFKSTPPPSAQHDYFTNHHSLIRRNRLSGFVENRAFLVVFCLKNLPYPPFYQLRWLGFLIVLIGVINERLGLIWLVPRHQFFGNCIFLGNCNSFFFWEIAISFFLGGKLQFFLNCNFFK